MLHIFTNMIFCYYLLHLKYKGTTFLRFVKRQRCSPPPSPTFYKALFFQTAHFFRNTFPAVGRRMASLIIFLIGLASKGTMSSYDSVCSRKFTTGKACFCMFNAFKSNIFTDFSPYSSAYRLLAAPYLKILFPVQRFTRNRALQKPLKYHTEECHLT